MESLIGMYIACKIGLTIQNLNGDFYTERVLAKCLVVDDRFAKVGDPVLHNQQPIIVDCSMDENVKMLKPQSVWPQLLMKEDSCDE